MREARADAAGETTTNILVLGIGNVIMSDDGVGARVVQEMQREFSFTPGVELVDGGTLGLDLLPLLEGKSHLIMVDAVQTGKAPGSCVRLTGNDLPAALETKLSPHQVGLKELLAVARLTGQAPPEVVLIGVQPRCLDIGAELTPEVSLQVETMKGAVLKELERLGAHAEPYARPRLYKWDQ